VTVPDPSGRRWISIEEAGRYFGVGKARAHQLARAGVIPTLQISERRWLVPVSALQELEEAVIRRARGVVEGADEPQAEDAPLQLAPRRPRRSRR